MTASACFFPPLWFWGFREPLFLCHAFGMQLPCETPFQIELAQHEVLRGYLHDTGSGPIGVFLPGFASDMQGSKSQLLAQHAQRLGRSWLRFDYRGIGRSDGDFAGLSISRYLEDVEAILALVAPRPLVLVGSSMGGWVATLAAQRYPQRIRALLLIAPAYNFIQDYFAALPTEEQKDWQETGLRHWQLGPYGPRFPLAFGAVEDAAAYDLLRHPPRLAIPTLILHGSADDAVPLQRSFTFADLASSPSLAIRVLPGIDHRLQGAERQLLQGVDEVWLAVAAAAAL